MHPATTNDPVDLAVLLRDYSIELNPREQRIIDAASGRRVRGTGVCLTWIFAADSMGMVAESSSLHYAGLIPVPHMTARHIESASLLERLAAPLVAEAGVVRFLIVGTDFAGHRLRSDFCISWRVAARHCRFQFLCLWRLQQNHGLDRQPSGPSQPCAAVAATLSPTRTALDPQIASVHRIAPRGQRPRAKSLLNRSRYEQQES